MWVGGSVGTRTWTEAQPNWNTVTVTAYQSMYIGWLQLWQGRPSPDSALR